MIKSLKEWWANYKARAQKERKERINHEVNEDFNVTERHGYLYLIAGCRAVAKLESNQTVEEVIHMLNKARIAQIDFKKNENLR